MGSGPYHVVKVGADDADRRHHGHAARSQGMPPMWGCYVTVADCDATAAQCTALGGKVCVGPMDIPTVGRLAMLQDPQGATICVIAYAPRPG